MGVGHVTAIDIDQDAIAVFQNNIEELDDELPISVLVCNLNQQLSPKYHQLFDTTIMNPPFGTRAKGADMAFLQQAMTCTRGAIYSLHKSSTRAHVARQGRGEWNGKVIAEMKFDLPRSYKFHKKDSVDVHVDLWRFERVRNLDITNTQFGENK